MAFLLLIGGVRKGTKIGLGYEGVRNCIKCYVSRHKRAIIVIREIYHIFLLLRLKWPKKCIRQKITP